MKDLGKYLPVDRYPKERYPWLVELMKAFALIFEDDQGRLLLPGLLPMDSPDWAQPFEWTGENILHLELRYDAVLPESVISKFIVRSHKDARNPGEWWRHGIALKHEGCEALVRAHFLEQDAKIELRLRGPRLARRDLLSRILETLRDPRDSLPPELHVVLGEGAAPKYRELLIHAMSGKRKLDFIIANKSVSLELAKILDLIESPEQQSSSHQQMQFRVDIRNENKPSMNTEQYILESETFSVNVKRSIGVFL
jgi:internalin A